MARLFAHTLRAKTALFFLVLVVGYQPFNSHAGEQELWKARSHAFELDKIVLDASPLKVNPSAWTDETRPGKPFTYEEQFYDRPRREWWWAAGKYTIIILGGLILTYCTAGLITPWIGGTIGGLTGLSGAAAVSKGLAILGGGAIAAGGFGMAGGTIVVGLVTDFAISTALEYSLDAFESEPRLDDLNQAIAHLDANVDRELAWTAVEREAKKALEYQADYPVIAHALATACMRMAASENIAAALQTEDITESEEDGLSPSSDRQQVLMLLAIRLLDEASRLEPNSSVIQHSLANAYWWLSVRGGFQMPSDVPELFALPPNSRIQFGKAGDYECQTASFWHFVSGAASEPRNANLRMNWANSLQADGRGHEAIGVVAAAIPTVATLREEDKLLLLKNHAMLQYQAYTRTTYWDNAERDADGKKNIEIQKTPHLLAAMQSYTAALEDSPNDLIALGTLLQIYRETNFQMSEPPDSVLPESKVSTMFIDAILNAEKALSSKSGEDKVKQYEPGQLMKGYCELFDYAFIKAMKQPSSGDSLKEKHRLLSDLIPFLHKHEIGARPFSRDDCLEVFRACEAYNDKVYFSAWHYDISTLDQEIRLKIEDGNDGNTCGNP